MTLFPSHVFVIRLGGGIDLVVGLLAVALKKLIIFLFVFFFLGRWFKEENGG